MVGTVATEFSPALELVLGALEQMRDGGGKPPRASRGALIELHQRAFAPRVEVTEPVVLSRIDVVDRAGGGDKARLLAQIQVPVSVCTKCPHLARSRTQTVFGVGNAEAELMFIGEAPGAVEDARGEPFVGPAGELLTKIIGAMGLARDDVYIANVLKCRPDAPRGNRPPTPEEMETCLPYLAEQIRIIQPKVLVALGGTAVEGLLGPRGPMHAMRGRWHTYEQTPLMITYHPSYLLRPENASHKRKVWEDMLQVLERLGHPITEKQRRYFA